MDAEFPHSLNLILLIVSIGALLWGADRFVAGCASIASNLGLSPLIIGLTVVSFGTSAPEILVSASAALAGSASMAVGNALGSNMANMGLVLACTALIFPLRVDSRVSHSAVPIMIVITLLAGVILWDGTLSRPESALLVGCLLAYMLYLARTAGSRPLDPDLKIHRSPWGRAIFLTLGGLLFLLIGSNVLVISASGLASALGISDLVIGITVVAVGTSLPELATSVAGALRGHSEMVIGNIIGSNIFNLTAVLPVAGLIQPGLIAGANFHLDTAPVIGLSLILALICLWKTRAYKSGSLSRPTGALMLLLYIGYYGVLLAE